MKSRGLVLGGFMTLFFAMAAMAAPNFESVAPENTAGFFYIRSIPKLKTDFQGTSLEAILNEPSVKAFFEKPKAKLNEVLAEQEGKMGVKLDDLLGLFQGQIGILFWMDQGEKEPSLGCMIEIGQQADKAMETTKALVLSITKEANEAEPTFVEEAYGGTKIIAVKPAPVPGEEPNPDADTLHYAVSGDVFVMSLNSHGIKRLIDFISAPPASSLAGTASYKAMMQKLSPDSDVVLYAAAAPIIQMVKSAMEEHADGNDQEMAARRDQFNKTVEALGINTMDALGYGLRTDGDFGVSTLFLRVVGEPKGITKILMPAPGPLHDGAQVTADATQFLSGRFEPAVIWDEVERIIAGISPEAMMALNAQFDQFGQQIGQPFNLRNDILAVFGPRASLYTWYEKPFNLETSEQIVLTIDITSKAAFDAAYQKLLKLIPPLASFKEQEYLGNELYVMQPMEGMPPDAEAPSVGFAVTEKEFVFSNKAADVQAHLRRAGGEGETLAKVADFQEAMQPLPVEGRIAIGYEDGRKAVEYMLTLMRDGQFDSIIGMFTGGDPDIAAFVDLFDLKNAPPPEDITKHLYPSGMAATAGSDGLVIVQKTRIRAAAK